MDKHEPLLKSIRQFKYKKNRHNLSAFLMEIRRRRPYTIHLTGHEPVKYEALYAQSSLLVLDIDLVTRGEHIRRPWVCGRCVPRESDYTIWHVLGMAAHSTVLEDLNTASRTVVILVELKRNVEPKVVEDPVAVLE